MRFLTTQSAPSFSVIKVSSALGEHNRGVFLDVGHTRVSLIKFFIPPCDKVRRSVMSSEKRYNFPLDYFSIFREFDELSQVVVLSSAIAPNVAV